MTFPAPVTSRWLIPNWLQPLPTSPVRNCTRIPWTSRISVANPLGSNYLSPPLFPRPTRRGPVEGQASLLATVRNPEISAFHQAPVSPRAARRCWKGCICFQQRFRRPAPCALFDNGLKQRTLFHCLPGILSPSNPTCAPAPPCCGMFEMASGGCGICVGVFLRLSAQTLSARCRQFFF